MSRRQLERGPARADLPGDDTGCHVLHADMDAFFASVELRRQPELRGRPLVVGSRSGRSVVLAATYEARTYGVHSALPMSRALRLCPGLVVIEPEHSRYSEASKAVMEVFRSITPLVEPLASDEAFLDVSGATRRLGSPREIAAQIRSQIAAEQQLPCSVGVASTKFVAKLASSQAKPDGLLVVPRDAVVQFLHPLPIGALWGVGDRTEETLSRLGMRTIADLAVTAESTLISALGKAAGSHLHALAWGRDERTVTPNDPERSIGAEETFAQDVDDPIVIRRELLRLAERCAARLRASQQVGRTVSIKVRFADFTTVTRSRTLTEPTDVARVVYDTARGLHAALGRDDALIRLVGVRVEGLRAADDTPLQLSLSGDDEEWRAAEQAVDQATARFGAGAVRPASLVSPHAARRTGSQDVREIGANES
jgi:DNA polymerase IV